MALFCLYLIFMQSRATHFITREFPNWEIACFRIIKVRPRVCDRVSSKKLHAGVSTYQYATWEKVRV